jgi:hypothetical protein
MYRWFAGTFPAVKPGFSAVLCASLCFLGLAAGSATAQVSSSVADRSQAVTRRNADLMQSLHAYRLVAGDAANMALLKQAALQRHNELANLISSDPAAVLAAALPDDVRNEFPTAVRELIEQRVTLHGEMQVAIEDGQNYSRIRYGLVVAGKQLELHFAGDAPAKFQTGDHVRIEGVQVGEAMATSSAAATSTTTASTTTSSTILPSTYGAQKTLVILVNFQDEAIQPVTSSYVSGLVFGSTSSVSAWWLENSFQQTWATGDVAGWYTIPVSYTTCSTSSIATYGNSAAQSAGYILGNYQHLVYVFPNNACTWWGYSTIGGSPSQSWIRDYTNATSGVALMNLTHELGHSLGLYHSHGWNCSAYPGSGCTSNEYGDTLDVMGNFDYVTSPHYDSFQKERLGWLNYSAQPPIQTVTASGNYTLAPYETQDAGVKAIRIPQSNGAWYYVEYRTPAGFDSFLNGNINVLNGVVVRLATPGSSNSSELLNIPSPSAETMTPALDVAQTYTDSAAGVTVSPVSVGSAAAVQITFGAATCTLANPTVSMIGPSSSVAPGSAASYDVTVKDNDSPSCGSSTFGLSDSVPSGWTGVYSVSALTLAPGASATATLSATAPIGTANGTYAVEATAANTSATTYAASSSATETIYTPASVSVSITTNQWIYAPGQKITASIAVLAGGTPVSGVSVKVNITKSNGSIVTLNGTTGLSGIAVVNYTVKKNDPSGTWDAAGFYTSASASTTFSVQ